MSTIEKKMEELNLKLPTVAKPIAAYVPGVKIDNLVFTSGQIPVAEGKVVYQGHVGAECSLEDAYEAAKICVLNCLAVVKELTGDLDRITKIVKITGFVASAPGFNDQPKVINGASEILVQLFGEKGAHARSAVGLSELPLNVPVEVEMIVSVE